MSTSRINKIFPNSTIIITEVGNFPFFFQDGLLKSREDYDINTEALNLREEASSNISFYNGDVGGNCWEFRKSLKNWTTIIQGEDIYGMHLGNLNPDKSPIMVFVNGKLLTPNQFVVLNSEQIQIKLNYPVGQINTIQIYTHPLLVNYGVITAVDPITHEVVMDYDPDRTLIFYNGEKVAFSDIVVFEGKCKLNIPLKETDRLEYYKLPIFMKGYHFLGELGFVTYSLVDYYNHKIPAINHYSIQFDRLASLVVDNLRRGFLIKEVDGPGLLSITSTDFDTSTLTGIKLTKFKKTILQAKDYYLQVPECKSIVDYLTPFDKKFKLLPEVLTVFQELLLNEIYDSVQRLRQIRSLSNVDSSNINRLIKFLGFNMNISQLSLGKRKEILNELNNYYRIVGTRDSYNFFNIIEDSFALKHMEQLFTYHDSNEEGKREYVDFFTKEEAGAIHHGPIWQVDGEDYGSVADKAELFEDRGPLFATDVTGVDCFYVTDKAGGRWIEWWEWDRPKNCYPTNHVKTELKVNPGYDSASILEEFTTKFYDIASAVVFLHDIIQSYTIGPETEERQSGNPQTTGQIPQFGIMGAPAANFQYYGVANDAIFDMDRFDYVSQLEENEN